MLIVYGIKTCQSVQKALRFFKAHDIEASFFDFRKDDLDEDKINSWVEKSDINILFNTKGLKYRTLKLKELNLDEKGKISWLNKEPMLFKRPVIEYNDKLLVGFDEELYKKTFLN